MAPKPTTGQTQIAYRIAQSNGFSIPQPKGLGASATQPAVDVAGWTAFRNKMAGNAAGGTAPGAAGAPMAPVAPATPAAPPDPMGKVKDSGYFSAIAQNLTNRTTGLAGLGLSDQHLQENRDSSLTRLARQFTQQQQNITQGANKQGLFYSGQLGKRLGDAETAYNDQTTGVTMNATHGMESNQVQRGSLLRQYGDPNDPKDYGVSGMTALSDATGRYQAAHPVPDTVLGRPGEGGMPEGFNKGGWGGLAPGWTVEWDPTTGKAKRLVKQ